MITFLIVAAIILIIIGICFMWAYQRRRAKLFDETCNRYFVLSVSFLISSAVMCVIDIILTVFHLL